MASDEEVGRQILSIFMQHKVGASGVLRRNNFIDVRDADFQRGLNKAVENRWIKIKSRDRYTYELTEAGLAAGLNAGLPPKPLTGQDYRKDDVMRVAQQLMSKLPR
jgi:hypothetical protein